MRITLAEGEFYELTIPQEIDLEQLEGVISKLKSIAKIAETTNSTNVLTFPSEWDRARKKARSSREEAIIFLKELRELTINGYIRKYGFDISDASVYNFTSKIKAKFNITEADLQ